MSFSHRSGLLKQQNKKHKQEKKRSDSKSSDKLRKISKTLNKRERRLSLKQKRSARFSSLKKVVSTRGSVESPLWCVLVPLTPQVPTHLAKLLLQKCDPDAVVTEPTENNLQHVVQLSSPLLGKHFRILSAMANDLFGCIDLIHMSDWVILLIPSDFNSLDTQTEEFLTALYAQGLGDVSFAVMSSGSNLKEIKTNLQSRFPVPEDTVYALNTPAHALNLLRHISSTPKLGANKHKHSSASASRSAARFRARLLADSIRMTNHPTGITSEAEQSTDATTGRLHGAPLYFHEPLEQNIPDSKGPFVHLTGWGDFPLAWASWTDKSAITHRWSLSDLALSSGEFSDLKIQPCKTEGKDMEEDEEDSDDSNGSHSMDSIQASLDEDVTNDYHSDKLENLPTQTDSQTMDVEDDMDDDQHSSSDAASLSTFAAKTRASSKGSAFSASQLAKFRAAQTPVNVPARERFAKYRSLPRFQGSVWPVERDVLPTHYENIACFKNYHRNRRSIIRYLQLRLVKTETDQLPRSKCIPSGVEARVTLGPLNRELACMIIERHTPSITACDEMDFDSSVMVPPLVLWSLLPHENRISVCHFALRRLTSAMRATSDLVAIANAAKKVAETSASMSLDAAPLEFGEEAGTRLEQEDQMIRDMLSEHVNRKSSMQQSQVDPDNPVLIPPEAEPIQSKELMLFQAGVRRFVAAPIYSTQTTSVQEKAKFESFFSASQSTVVATVYAPVMYAPVNVLQFRVRIDEDDCGNLSAPYVGELVATGTLHSVDPSRLVVKRIVLSGHPYKIHKRNAVVRFMFFNPTDVEYFKAVPLHTKSGAVGNIKEPVGTHGYMKCVFDRPLQASDVVLLPLYKRIFPKWVYHPVIAKVFRSKLPARPTHTWEKAPITLQLSKKKSSTSSDFEPDEMTMNAKQMAMFA
ncbi:hypothetical protein EG68_09048 [Paragonimus skrjabini miyazakii]|uniref:Pre-rRNA-processing protein TSR1 homolog n=1 Tax=Paragonimus skrjabini miyazakii TaxID=59628 RepID=A0A8S9YIJ3_9TREM|nr:hypothetical protein EG68_09048 [Paragonimus skrjabini miyazakii]